MEHCVDWTLCVLNLSFILLIVFDEQNRGTLSLYLYIRNIVFFIVWLHVNKECAILILCDSLHYKSFKRQHIWTNFSFDSEMTCKKQHPFTAVVAGPTGCGKSAWVLRLVDNAVEIIEPPPNRMCYCYGEYQPTFNNYPQVTSRRSAGTWWRSFWRATTCVNDSRRSDGRDQSASCIHFHQNFASS